MGFNFVCVGFQLYLSLADGMRTESKGLYTLYECVCMFVWYAEACACFVVVVQCLRYFDMGHVAVPPPGPGSYPVGVPLLLGSTFDPGKAGTSMEPRGVRPVLTLFFIQFPRLQAAALHAFVVRGNLWRDLNYGGSACFFFFFSHTLLIKQRS